MNIKLFGLVALLALSGLSPAGASTFDYNVSFNIGTDSVTGSIVTNCDNGCVLDPTNVVSWSFMVPGFASISSSGVSPAGIGTLPPPHTHLLQQRRQVSSTMQGSQFPISNFAMAVSLFAEPTLLSCFSLLTVMLPLSSVIMIRH